MNSPYIVQRLCKPYSGSTEAPLGMICKFGLAATGFNQAAKEALSKICIFDYMGSSEYEFGTIPEAFRNMSQKIKELHAYKICCPYSYSSWDKKQNKDGIRDIYIIACESDIKEIKEYLLLMAKGEEHCKERTNFASSLAESEYDKNVFGWFDLCNLFMFFKDEGMFNNFCEIFGIQTLEILLVERKGQEKHGNPTNV